MLTRPLRTPTAERIGLLVDDPQLRAQIAAAGVGISNVRGLYPRT
jgi:hypothetical protein